MADLRPLANIAQDDTIQALNQLNDTMLFFLSAMLEKMPRVDANDRLVVNLTDMTNTLGTVSTVTTVSAVTNLTNLNNISGGNAVLVPYNLTTMGASILYNNIQVS